MSQQRQKNDREEPSSPANIHQHARDRVIQIGQLWGDFIIRRENRMISLLLLGLVLVPLIVNGVRYYRSRHPGPMGHSSFNIAVAAFSFPDDLPKAELYQGIDQNFYTRLEGDKETLARRIEATAAEIEVRGPQFIGPIKEDAPLAAQKIAKQYNADVVIYGHVKLIDDDVVLIPRFFVNYRFGGSEDDYFYHVEEIIEEGKRLGRPIQLNRRERARINAELAARMQAFILIARGLNYYADYENYHNYTEALKLFQQALQVEQWDDREGKDVLYGVMGFSALKLGLMAEAQAWCQKSLDANPEYARAYLCMGNVWYEYARELFMIQRDSAQIPIFLAQAEEMYLETLKPWKATSETYVPLKAHTALGRTYSLQAQVRQKARTLLCDELTPAKNKFDYIIAEYKQIGDVEHRQRIRKLASDAYYERGLIAYYCQENQLTCTSYYQQAFKLSPEPHRQVAYARDLAIFFNYTDPEKAEEWRAKALTICEKGGGDAGAAGKSKDFQELLKTCSELKNQAE